MASSLLISCSTASNFDRLRPATAQVHAENILGASGMQNFPKEDEIEFHNTFSRLFRGEAKLRQLVAHESAEYNHKLISVLQNKLGFHECIE